MRMLCRVANIRKHQLLKPEIKVLVTAIDSITPRYADFKVVAGIRPQRKMLNVHDCLQQACATLGSLYCCACSSIHNQT